MHRDIDSESAASHARQAVAWGVPTAVERGEIFTIKLGVKCAAACKPRDWRIEIHGHDGRVVASGLIGNTLWPGTAALYYTEVTLTAPDAEGLFSWQAIALRESDRGRNQHEPEPEHEDEHEHEHEAARAAFNVRVSPPAECRLTVVAVDRVTRAPIERAKVVIHPYRALTDERGVAVLRVPNGRYRMFVSGRDYFPFRCDGVASGDATVCAALETDAGPTDEELWS